MVRPLPLGALVAMLLSSLVLASTAAAQTEPVPPVQPAPEQPAQEAPPVVITDPEAAIEEGREPEQQVLGNGDPRGAGQPGTPAPAPQAATPPAPAPQPGAETPAPAAGAAQELPFTGLSAGWIALMGASMLLLGAALLRRTEGIDEG